MLPALELGQGMVAENKDTMKTEIAVSQLKPGDEVYVKKRTKWHDAKVIQTYDCPRAGKIEYCETFERWIVTPEEVLTKEQKEAEKKAERDAQRQ